jgi:hypothetical protein
MKKMIAILARCLYFRATQDQMESSFEQIGKKNFEILCDFLIIGPKTINCFE